MPSLWKESRLYHTPFAEDYNDRIKVETVELPENLDGYVFSPNEAYGYIYKPPDTSKKRPPWTTVIEIYNERDYVIRLSLIDNHASYETRITWISEKLLYIRVWWGRVLGSDLIFDVESEHFVYKEMIESGGIPFLQHQHAYLLSPIRGSAATASVDVEEISGHDWRKYRNTNIGIEIGYSNSFELALLEGDAYSGFTGKRTAIAEFVLIDEKYYRDTNLSKAALFIAVGTDGECVDDCLRSHEETLLDVPNPRFSELLRKRLARQREIHGTMFHRFTRMGIYEGNRYEMISYKTLHNNVCYQLDMFIRSEVMDAFDLNSGVSRFDKDGVIGALDHLLLSFRLIESDNPIPRFARRLEKEIKEVYTNRSIIDILLVRVIRDFNNDGIDDIALASSLYWGQASAPWEIHLRGADRSYTYLGKLDFHPLSISIQPIDVGSSKIVTYHRMGADGGHLVERILSSDGISRVGMQEIRWEDSEAYQKVPSSHPGKSFAEHCKLSDYLDDEHCAWFKGYY